MALCKLLVACSGVASFQVHGARLKLNSSASEDPAKFIAGVPVLNYEQAYDGVALASLPEGTKGKWIVVTDYSVSDDDIKHMCEDVTCGLMGHPDQDGVRGLSFEATESDLEALLKDWAARDLKVRFVESDSIISMRPIIAEFQENTPELTWGLNRIGADLKQGTGKGAHIYVLDTGVHHTHLQFEGRAGPGIDVTSGRVVTCTTESAHYTGGSCGEDRNGHGTHLAGTAAGKTYGVATDARVYGAKVIGNDGNGRLSWAQAALDWIVNSGSRPAVVSMSFGGSGTLYAVGMRGEGSLFRAVRQASDANVLVVTAAGDEADTECLYSPNPFIQGLMVASTDKSDGRSAFSNYGSCLDRSLLWAPGSKVESAIILGTWDDHTNTFSGTSHACAHVTGAVALAAGAHPDRFKSSWGESLLDNSEFRIIAGGGTHVQKFLNIRGFPEL